MIKRPANYEDLSMDERVIAALQAAYETVVIEHARKGRSIVVWRDGKMVEVGPEELRREAAKIFAE